ncbi:PA14 domain-containing protein,virulence plasmid 28 protein [Paenibacillus mesophilus]|uniref:neuraminidase-like domain-containing protein n=1 Tax=Paenibacillus mesophilus TaxID=2582849 RepID=UPI00110DAB4B|nr:neuraminidase-like domain-containing protein [Paenibacillus mesophilus]TMV44388.1 PA14 domain-containing protein,virulence plasmid 28 protein [Paenibacillus mesophilus]
MKRILFPLKPNMTGAEVAALHECLQFLLDKGVYPFSEDEKREYAELISVEARKNVYADVTQKLVAIFQELNQISSTGDVDEQTANALNAILEKLGAFEQTEQPDCERNRLVGGRVVSMEGKPFVGGLIRAYHADARGNLRIGEDTSDIEGQYTIRYEPLPDNGAIVLFVAAYDASGKLLGQSEVLEGAGNLEIVDLVVSIAEPEPEVAMYRVEGKASSRISAGVSGLRVRIVDKAVGADVLLVETVTGEGGSYRASFSEYAFRQRGKQRPDLQAIVYAAADNTVLGSSDVRYNAAAYERIDVRLDASGSAASALQAEHDTLTGTISRHYRGKLGELKETDDRQDITYLANKTGWDARAVALAALADQFSAGTAIDGGSAKIEPAFFYALFRTGLPANETAIYELDGGAVESIWKQAITQGIIPTALASRIPAAVEQFRETAGRRMLASDALVGASALKEIVDVSFGDEPERRSKFAELYARYRDDTSKLWSSVRDTLGESTEQRLKLDGQLAYLTLNNAPLMRKLHAAGGSQGLTDTLNLVSGGFYKADRWKQAIGSDPIPPEITGDNEAARANRYAELLAAKVRLSFPTAVVSRMVLSGETKVADERLRTRIHTVLNEHQGKFEIGGIPVEQYAKLNQAQIEPEVMNEITRIQRVYQITPSDEAMNALLLKGIDSAYAVTRYDRDDFIRAVRDEVGGEEHARLIYAKSQQVHNAVLNIAMSYMTASNAPGVGVHSPAQIIDPAPTGPNPHSSDVIAYSTLESLFNSLDYCTCSHCRSILSPAAYLVDLLLFIDRPTVPTGFVNPQTILLERRPDIAHLPLTCENTNTPLPYIDLVNETLEYYIANKLTLSGYTGHNTDGSAATEQLLANPQYVSDKAYETIAGKTAVPGDPAPLLPPASTLPFHRPLELMRRLFAKFEAPIATVMESLRQDDRLERANAGDYGWRDIWMEELRLSRAEYALLTDRTIPLKKLYGFAETTADTDVMSRLENVKSFTRRVEISYEDIFELLKTRTINPYSTLIPKLERLGVPIAALKALKDGAITDAEFDAALAPHLDQSQYGGNVKEWVKNPSNYANIMGLLTISDPNGIVDASNFDKLVFRYANPDPAAGRVRSFEFVRLLRFIRLQKKLGWSIEQTDKAITALYPAEHMPNDTDDAVNLQKLDAGYAVLLPRLGVLSKVMDELKLVPSKDLLPLLACFAPIDTHGYSSLYRQLFLSPAMLKQDSAFSDDGYGRYLDGTEKLIAHSGLLRAAFRLTDEEFGQLAESLSIHAGTPLTVDNISAIYRRSWLARKLKLGVKPFMLLCRYTGFDPFVAIDPVHPQLLRFIAFVNRLKASSIKPEEALYWIWNVDASGRTAPSDGDVTEFARMLRAEFAAADAEFALSADPDGQSAKAKLALLYGNEAAESFIGLLNRSVTSDVAYSHDQPALQTDIATAAAGQLAYDSLRKRLIYRAGAMPDAVRTALHGAASATDAFKEAVDRLYRQSRTFFERYPELLPHYDAYVRSASPDEEKRSQLLAGLLPELKQRRKRQRSFAAIGAAVKAEDRFAQTVLDDANVLHAAADQSRPALDDLTAIEQNGLTARFYYGATAEGAVGLEMAAEADLSYSISGGHPLPANPTAGSAVSGTWSGYAEAAETGACNFHIEADPEAVVTLVLDGAPVPLTRTGAIWSNSAPIKLRAGTLYAIAIRADNVKQTLHFRWETSGRGRETIPARYLYSEALVGHLRQTYIRYAKTAVLSESLQLTTADVAFHAGRAEYRIGGESWLNGLPTSVVPDPALSAALYKSFRGLLEVARLKAELAPKDERLLAVLRDPAAAALDADGPLYILTRWEEASLQTLLTRFGVTIADLASPETFGRVFDAYGWVNKLGVSASAMLRAAFNEPDAAAERELQSALRARFAEEDWLIALKPINDEMRRLQRDALVAYIIHQMKESPASAHIDTPDKLFEYFLMDVQMEPCMQTSRIRHALSSIQLFIERCLMNLEPRAAPSTINAKQWQWMSRYRIWEANRKVFLYPENWLEPELRDDQSPFFKEAMSELLQNDITDDRAATALLHYLSKLEEVAKLEPCGIHYAENDSQKAEDDIAHVVARTAGANRKYFYRRREYGYWTAWEQIKLDIEDDPVIPVVWKNRLLLFWLKIVKDSPMEKPDLPDGDMAGTKADDIVSATTAAYTVKAILCWSEYYNGKWQPVKTSDVNRPTELGQFKMFGSSVFNRSELRLSVSASGTGGALTISISGQGQSSFRMYNTHSLPVRGEDIPFEEFDLKDIFEQSKKPSRKLDPSGSIFTITYRHSGLYHLDIKKDSSLTRAVVKNGIGDRVIEPLHPLQNPWDAPFFYEDSRHLFYVKTAERIVRIPEWNEYVPIPKPNKDWIIPNLVMPEFKIPKLPREVFDMVGNPGIKTVRPEQINRFVTEDAYIKQGIGTLGTVLYGDKEIGLTGRVSGSVRY